MNTQTQDDHAASLPSARLPRPKWPLVFFALAAFNLLTVGLSFYFGHQVMDSFLGSIQAGEQWRDRLAQCASLVRLAMSVTAPGDDVFETKDVPAENARLEKAFSDFQTAATAVQEKIKTSVTGANSLRLLKELNDVRKTMTNTVNDAKSVFSYFAQNQIEQAGEQMARMDRSFVRLVGELDEMFAMARAIWQADLSRQWAQAVQMRRYEFAIAGAIVLMVIGIAFYGHRLSRQSAEEMREKEQHLAETRASEAALRHVNQQLNEALAEVKELSGLLPICMGCKKIRDDKNFWHSVESYFTKHSKARFSHGYCPECFEKVLKTEMEALQARLQS